MSLLMSAMLLAGLTAQNPLEVSQRMEVTSNGAELVREFRTPQGSFFVKPDSGSLNVVTGPRWSENSGGLAWICQDIAVGDNGAAVIAGKYLNNQSSTVYSTGDSMAIFDFVGGQDQGPFVAMADRTNVSAAMHITDLGVPPNFDFEATVSVFDNCDASGTPSWSFTFPTTLNFFGGGVAVSDDGSVVLAWKADPNVNMLRVEAFDGAGNSISSGMLASGTLFNSRQTRLSDDGSRAYFNIGADAIIYDVASGTEIHRHVIGASFDSHALSGDGTHFAFGNFGFFEVYSESSPGVWTLKANSSFAGGTYVARVDLNTDGSRLGYQVQYFSANDQHDIGMHDTNTNVNMFTASYTSPGTLFQNVAFGVEVDDNGDYVAGCAWGDDANVTPEGFVYDSAGNLTCEIDSAGSAFDCSLDADGDVFAMGTKGVHANTFGNGGDVIVADAYDQTLHILGYPQLGGAVTVEAPALGSTLQLGVCDALGNSPSSLGVTELDLSTLLATFNFSIPGGGLSQSVTIPNSAALACRDVHCQGGILSGGSGQLTNKVSLRLLP